MKNTRRIACLTMAKNESLFLPIWFSHYAPILGQENLFVIDHNSEKRPSEIINDSRIGELNTFKIPFDNLAKSSNKGRSFDGIRHSMVTHIVNALLETYDTVIFGDADELLIADPDHYGSLSEAISDPRYHAPTIAGLGLEILHDFREEPDLKVDSPVLRQRKNYTVSPWYSKPHIFNAPCRRISAHGVSGNFGFHPGIFLLHLGYADRRTILERSQVRLDMMENLNLPSHNLWNDAPIKKIDALAELLDLPVSDTDFPHFDLSEFGSDISKKFLFGSEDGPEKILTTRNSNTNKFVEYISRKRRRQLLKSRGILPARFLV